MTDPTTALREVLALSNKERDAEENREYGAANDLYAELQVAAVNLIRTHGPALLSALEDAQWRPIETAPRGGTRALLAIEWSDVPVVGKYSHGLWWADTEHHEVSCGAYCYGGSVSSDTNMKPTHWRPLPKSPAIDAAIAEGDQPEHDPQCAYMRDLHGDPPAATQQPAAVDEAMVERAARAWCAGTDTPFDQLPDTGKARCLEDMRVVLTAALAAQQGGES